MVAEVADVSEADAGTRASIWHSGQSCGRGNISRVVVIILAVATIIMIDTISEWKLRN